MAAWHGSRGNLYTGGGRTRTCQAKRYATGARARRIRAARLGMEGAQRRHDQEADDSARRLVRLVARKVYARSAALSRRSGSFSAAVPPRADLSRPLHRELVPALPDRAERPRNSARGA